MKKEIEKSDKPVLVHRYSDHPIVRKKVAEARAIFEKIDMSLLRNPPEKN